MLRKHPIVISSSLMLSGILSLATPAPPIWWSEGNPPVINPTAADHDNHGVANIGQAKWMVSEALRALDACAPDIAIQIRADLAGGLPNHSDRVVDLSIPDPKNSDWIERQKSPVVAGQLKAISAPFYTRLNTVAASWLATERGFNGTSLPGSIFPWTAETTDDQDKAIITIGQLKAVFSLRFETLDIDLDGLPDGWEYHYFDNLTSAHPNTKITPDGLTNKEKSEMGLSPDFDNLTMGSERIGYTYDGERLESVNYYSRRESNYGLDANGNIETNTSD